MPNINVSIGGSVISVPGVYYQDIVQSLTPSGPITGPLILIAPSYGCVPFLGVNFTDALSLTNAFRGAPCQDYVNFLFNPSNQLNGTQLVTYINPAPNTQSSATMISSGGISVINLVSTNYGAPSNLLQYSVANSSFLVNGLPIGKKLTFYDAYSGQIEEGDNLGVPFQIAYTGTASGVTYNVVTTSGGIATTFVTTSPNTGESLSIDLTSSAFATVSQLVSYINSTGFYIALVYSNGSLPTSMLDGTSPYLIGLPVPTGVIPNQVYNYKSVTATLGDPVYFLNTQANTLVTATLVPGVISSPSLILGNTALQYFTGGANVTPSIINYTSGLNVALNYPAWAVVVVTPTDAAVTAAGSNPTVFKFNIDLLGAAHAFNASSILQQKWRRYVTGSRTGEAALNVSYSAQVNAITLNKYMVTYAWPGIYRTNPNTLVNTLYSGHHVGAAAAGMMTGNPASTPLTNKTLIGNGTEVITDLNTKSLLQNSGVLVLDYPINTKIPTFLSDVTTWQQDSNNANVFNQEVSCRFALAYAMTAALQPYIGTAMSVFDVARARNATVSLLNSLIYNGQNAVGVLTSWDPTTLTLTFDSDTQILTVLVNVALVGQVRFIPITVTITPPNLQIVATVNSVTTVSN